MQAMALVPGTTEVRIVDRPEPQIEAVDEVLGPMGLIVEAIGVARLEVNLLDALAIDGVYMLIGIPGGGRPIDIPAAALIRQLVLGNQAMVGSVNAARDHFQMAVADLAIAGTHWPGHSSRSSPAATPPPISPMPLRNQGRMRSRR